MPKRALIEHRPFLLAGIAMAIAFWLASDSALGGLFQIALKGGSVAALAAYAIARSRARDARMIAAVMAIGAAGDVGMELNVVAGGGLFLLSHLVAIALYLGNRRARTTGSQIGASLALLVGVPLAAWLLARDPMAVVYAVALAAMAATAWLSRFSRYNVGVGALLFVASDLLIFARLGGVLGENVTEWFVWPLYYAGQFLICTGVIRTLRRDHTA
ncbi:YhhN-like protein [Tsuneonella dongtanensis]|uniref:YhhN-like protein n=1 Tax=Tsuneonella dongtanensis TaxID=692370 RepID=A0A1B2AEU8_9SPHN|nr:lysoplasmalogenase family protein [Tsuneonella dongtanensis]ANY20680.1 YhhN-like protein [Tsuneonella dongtanensis]